MSSLIELSDIENKIKKMDTFIKRICCFLIWVRSLMDKISGFGPADRGSNPRVPIELKRG